MQENRNTSYCSGKGYGQGTVCIDTQRVLDSCRDRDCFEDVRVYLSDTGRAILQRSQNIRTKNAEILCAYIGVEEVPFNQGFYQVRVKYYITLEFEVCVCGKSQIIRGLAVVEKDVILYGGEGRAISFTSGVSNDICTPCACGGTTNDPTAIVETVEPVVLGTKVSDCSCPCSCTCTDFVDIPESVKELFGECIDVTDEGPKVYVSIGVFSVIRIVRPTQILVQATDYSVPDKECAAATNNDNPCALFRTMPFPTSQFSTAGKGAELQSTGGGCGCNKG